jgi:hypothetical protein
MACLATDLGSTYPYVLFLFSLTLHSNEVVALPSWQNLEARGLQYCTYYGANAELNDELRPASSHLDA